MTDLGGFDLIVVGGGVNGAGIARTKSSGLGMGLSICRSIIEAHNGRLWASPNVPRGGAIFGFIAPAHPAAAS